MKKIKIFGSLFIGIGGICLLSALVICGYILQNDIAVILVLTLSGLIMGIGFGLYYSAEYVSEAEKTITEFKSSVDGLEKTKDTIEKCK